MRGILDWEGRFGVKTELSANTQPQPFMDYLNYHGFTVAGSAGPPNFTPQFSAQVTAILGRHLPVPQRVLEQGVTASDYYTNISYWSNWYATTYPTQTDLDLEFDPVLVADELWERVVTPTLAAGELFKINPKLTRLFTTISPSEMTRDPVFSFNPELPDVPNVRSGKLQFHCGFIGVNNSDITTTPATIVTDQGWKLKLPNGTAQNPWLEVNMPASWKTQSLREEGQPEDVSDNTAEINSAIDGTGNSDGGCQVAVGGGAASAGGLGLIGLALLLIRRRKR